MRLRVRVPAKINLHLQVLGRRPDGFHEVRTLLQSIDLYDDLVAEPADERVLQLEVVPPGVVTSDEDNLVLQAARRLWGSIGRRPGARLRLRKRIPVGGGLGGGSADAAGALIVLGRLWSAGVARDDIQSIAAELGSDVPFSLHGGLALGVGRGEHIRPLPDPPRELGVLIAAPGVGISTAAVYGRIQPQLTWNGQEANVYALSARVEDRLRWETMVNDLQPVVLEGWPVVAEVLNDLASTGPLRAAVSGSGAAVYAVYNDRRSAERAAEGVSNRWWTHVGVLLDRDRARPVVKSEEDRI
jgi:4-diphosphocytidyl-2-C-methyl-D-erythritol kinase